MGCLPGPASPQHAISDRVRSLTTKIAVILPELAIRKYFRLPTWRAGEFVPDPKDEAIDLFVWLSVEHGVTVAEGCEAFEQEWKRSINIAVQIGSKLRATALTYLQAPRSIGALLDAFSDAQLDFPDGWPRLATKDLKAIAMGFCRPEVQTREGRV